MTASKCSWALKQQKRRLFADLSPAHVFLPTTHSPPLFCKSPSWNFLTGRAPSCASVGRMLKRSCKEFASFHSIAHLKALVGIQNKIKNLRIFQKWKPSLIEVKEAGGCNSFVKSLEVQACASGRQGGKCQRLFPRGN